MEPPSPDPLFAGGEDTALAALLDELGRLAPPPDLSDDCARLDGRTDLVTTDSLVEGVHFDLARDTPAQVGAQAAVANLSDLAASGAGPFGLWLVWALCLPRSWTMTDLRALTRGFAEVSVPSGARIVGGNLSRIEGPAVISVTAGGPLAGDRALTRAGAQPGDVVYLTGDVGDAALGVSDPDPAARAARHRWRPHLAEAAALARWGRVTAMTDVSDGVLRDAGRVAAASGVAFELSTEGLPLSPFYRSRRRDPELALQGGEDYVLLFTAPEGPVPRPAHPIGRVVAGHGLRLDGAPVSPRGFDHFADSSPRSPWKS